MKSYLNSHDAVLHKNWNVEFFFVVFFQYYFYFCQRKPLCLLYAKSKPDKKQTQNLVSIELHFKANEGMQKVQRKMKRRKKKKKSIKTLSCGNNVNLNSFSVHIHINVIVDSISVFLILNIISIRFEWIDLKYEWENLVIDDGTEQN